MLTLIAELWLACMELFTRTLFKIGTTDISFAFLVTILLCFIGIVIFCRLIKHVLKQYLLVHLGIDEGNREAISTIVSYALGTLAFIFFMQVAGFNFASLAVLAGALGVGIGFGLQDFSRDFIGGLTLLLERNIKVGDFVEMGMEAEGRKMQGTIRTISLRSATIQTRNGANLIVPNNRLVEFPVLNWGTQGTPARIILPVQVARENDLVKTTEVLLNVACLQPEVLSSPSPRVCFIGVEEDFHQLELHAWINHMRAEEYIRSQLYFAIEYHFRQQDIHFQPSYQEMIVALEPSEFIDPLATDRNRELSRRHLRLNPLQKLRTRPLGISDFLRQIKYFDCLDDLEIRQLLETGYRRRLSNQEILFREGDVGNAFYIVLEGQVEVVVETLAKQLSVLQSGHFFGELSLMLGIPRSATVRALEDTVLFAIDHLGFQKLLHRSPKFYDLLIEGMEKHQEEVAERQQEMRALGLIRQDEDESNPVDWARKRLKQLFAL